MFLLCPPPLLPPLAQAVCRLPLLPLLSITNRPVFVCAELVCVTLCCLVGGLQMSEDLASAVKYRKELQQFMIDQELSWDFPGMQDGLQLMDEQSEMDNLDIRDAQ